MQSGHSQTFVEARIRLQTLARYDQNISRRKVEGLYALSQAVFSFGGQLG